jgi:hypothetical protein
VHGNGRRAGARHCPICLQSIRRLCRVSGNRDPFEMAHCHSETAPSRLSASGSLPIRHPDMAGSVQSRPCGDNRVLAVRRAAAATGQENPRRPSQRGASPRAPCSVSESATSTMQPLSPPPRHPADAIVPRVPHHTLKGALPEAYQESAKIYRKRLHGPGHAANFDAQRTRGMIELGSTDMSSPGSSGASNR